MEVEWHEYNEKVEKTWPERPGPLLVWVHLFATDNIGLAWFHRELMPVINRFVAIGTDTPYVYKGYCDVTSWAYAETPDNPDEEEPYAA